MNLSVIMAIVLGVGLLWGFFGAATLNGIWEKFSGKEAVSLWETVFVVLFCPIIILAYALGKYFGIFHDDDKK